MVKKLDFIAQYVSQVHQPNVIQAVNVLSHEHDLCKKNQVEKVYFIGN